MEEADEENVNILSPQEVLPQKQPILEADAISRSSSTKDATTALKETTTKELCS